MILVASTALFHLANAPVMPLVALYVKNLRGTEIEVAAVVLIAQVVMVAVALLAGKLGDSFGRKRTMGIGFAVLPFRIALYALARGWHPARHPGTRRCGRGIYGVIVASMCADLTRDNGAFNTLMGIVATALALGGVIGPLASGLIVEHLGFRAGFGALSAVALVGGVPVSLEDA